MATIESVQASNQHLGHGGCAPKEPKKTPLAVRMLEDMEKLTMRLADLVSKVELKLEPVYLPIPPEPTNDKACAASEVYPELFDRTRSSMRRCNYSISQIEDILNKVEL